MEDVDKHSAFKNNSVFFIEVSKIVANPFQPRKDFDENSLKGLAESIRMYGVLSPIVVTRKEIQTEEGGLAVQYELIAGERRMRASKMAGLREIPALIRSVEDDDRVKLEIAIIENLQREDLNSVDRAHAFRQLADEFKMKHVDIAKKMGKSREYVSNTLRLLLLPPEILQALSERKISEGHTRPLLMLNDRPEEQDVLFREIMMKKMTVREAERISRKIAYDKVRKKDRMFNPEIIELEQQASDALGTRVQIEPKEIGGKIRIDYFSEDDLKKILEFIHIQNTANASNPQSDSSNHIAQTVQTAEEAISEATPLNTVSTENPTDEIELEQQNEAHLNDDRNKEEEEAFSIDDFTV